MIDEYSADRTGWARFSDDRKMRYRLARSLTDRGVAWMLGGRVMVRVVTFVMLNPSTADAFRVDPTVYECRKRALALGADVLQVANLFALRSPHPRDLRNAVASERGADATNDKAILQACSGPTTTVIAAWGKHGTLAGRDMAVRQMLGVVKLHHLGLTKDGHPKHPLARGRHRIFSGQQPIAWEETHV